MYIKYSVPKGRRIKKQYWGLRLSLNTKGDNLWWNKNLNKWMTLNEFNKLENTCSIDLINSNIRSLKSAIRHLKKHSNYIPKDFTFELISKHVGYDVNITI